MNEDNNFIAWAASVDQKKWAKADLHMARLAWDAAIAFTEAAEETNRFIMRTELAEHRQREKKL